MVKLQHNLQKKKKKKAAEGGSIWEIMTNFWEEE